MSRDFLIILHAIHDGVFKTYRKEATASDLPFFRGLFLKVAVFLLAITSSMGKRSNKHEHVLNAYSLYMQLLSRIYTWLFLHFASMLSTVSHRLPHGLSHD